MSSLERIIIHLADIPDAKLSGGRLRAGCPVHGSDHQRSLSIKPGPYDPDRNQPGHYAGDGQCFACGAKVLVEEMNPDWARRLQASGQSAITAEKLLRPVRRFQAEQTAEQQAELAALQALEQRLRSALLQSERAKGYLAGRCISYDLTSALGVGYLPPAWKDRPEVAPLQHWLDRLIFPLSSPDGRGYIGRALVGWHPGMDEGTHRALLKADKIPPYLKTNPAGWQGLAELAPSGERVIIVEGAFDRLALVAAGLAATNVVALVGSRDNRAAEWLPVGVQRAIIALDSDEPGKAAAEALRQHLYLAGIDAIVRTPPDDGLGKDWSERLRRIGVGGLAPVLEAFSTPAQVSVEVSRIPWRPGWDALPIKQRLYRMAEAAGFPALQVGDTVIGPGAASWYGLCYEPGHVDAAAEAYDTLLPRFEC